MRGFYQRRVYMMWSGDPNRATVAVAEFGGPLTDVELAAAREQGCGGCVWFVSRPNIDKPCCRHAVQAVYPIEAPDYWCSEWRGEPNKETP